MDLEKRMEAITDKKDIIEKISKENDRLTEEALGILGIKGDGRNLQNIHAVLAGRLRNFEIKLYEHLGRPNLATMADSCGKLCEVALNLNTPPKGFFIKKDKAVQMLDKFPPDNLLSHFGFKTASELVEKKGFASVFSSLRFAQSTEWMHKFFDEAYNDLTPDDFEERDVELKVLETEWLEVAEKFLKKKHHNLSHLKEIGIIFVVPIDVNDSGETLRLFSLLLHYLNEVPYYSGLFKHFSVQPDFIVKFKSLLRGDVPDEHIPSSDGGQVWRIVQRYLAKDDPNDFRLFEPHVNPEAEHWYKAGKDISGLDGGLNDEFISRASEFDFAGDFFPILEGGAETELKSFSLIDSVMTLVSKGDIKYVYHQQEALWNKIFIEYMGREKMNELVNKNIIEGFIKL